jgi:hypothetical protein
MADYSFKLKSRPIRWLLREVEGWLPSSSAGEWHSGIHRRAMVDSGANSPDVGLGAYFAFAEILWVYFWVYLLKAEL